MSDDRKRTAPAAARNRDPILEVLRRHMPARGLVLEIASGTGEHVVHFASGLAPNLVFQPTDPDAACRASIDAWTSELGVANVRPALDLDVTSQTWPVARADAIICINMIHIAPWAAAVGLMRGSGRTLAPGGLLVLYGPFTRADRPTLPGNAAFDLSLREQNPAWGLRDLDAVSALAADAGLGARLIVEMPANNLSVMFWRE